MLSHLSARCIRTNQVSPVCSYGGLLTLGERQRVLSDCVCLQVGGPAYCTLAQGAGGRAADASAACFCTPSASFLPMFLGSV